MEKPKHAWLMESAPGCQTTLNGRSYLYFAGTGYLGLQGHRELIAAATSAVQQHGIHTATSRTGFGTCPPVAEVERRAAEFLGSEAACYLVSGYAGNFAVAAALSGTVDLVMMDETAHDCLRESTRWLDGLTQPPVVFRHRDANHLAELLAAQVGPGQRPLVLSDGVFPISGRLAPLGDYLQVLDRYPGAALLVDDAHGMAVLGTQGRGSLELAGLDPLRINVWPADAPAASTPTRVYHTATLSKAIGGHGGVVAGSQPFVTRVKNSSGWFRAASAPAAPIAAATAKGLELAAAHPEWRANLARNVAQARSGLQSLGLPVEMSPSPVIGLALESGQRMRTIQEKLADDGIAIAFSSDYTGVGPNGMLRIAIFATHTSEMIDRLIESLRRAV